MRQFVASHRAPNSSIFKKHLLPYETGISWVLIQIMTDQRLIKNVRLYEELSRWLRCTTRGGQCQRTRTTLSWEDSRQRWPVRDSLKDNATGTTATMKIVLFKIILPCTPIFGVQLVLSNMTVGRHFCVYTIFLMEIFHEIYCHFDNAKLFTIW